MINTNYSISNKTFFTARQKLQVAPDFRERMLSMIEKKKAQLNSLLIELTELESVNSIKKQEFMQIVAKRNSNKSKTAAFRKAIKNATDAEYIAKKNEFSKITQKISLIKPKIATLKASIKNAQKKIDNLNKS